MCFPNASCSWKRVFFVFFFFSFFQAITWLLWLIYLCISLQWTGKPFSFFSIYELASQEDCRRYSYHLQHHKKVEWNNSFSELLLFPWEFPWDSMKTLNLDVVKIRSKIISICTSPDTKHFLNTAENSLALLFNYMWREVFHTAFASNSQFCREIPLSTLQRNIFKSSHEDVTLTKRWGQLMAMTNILFLKEILCWLHDSVIPSI